MVTIADYSVFSKAKMNMNILFSNSNNMQLD